MKDETPNDADRETAELVRSLLAALGEDPSREGLRKTPERVVNAYRFLTEGYRQTPEEVVKDAVFHEKVDEMVMIQNIDVYSLCEHHLLPFYGHCHVAYIPKGKVIGLSKVPRIVEIYSRRLQLQERLTNQIADAIQRILEPQGVAVVIDALHLCMSMRGVEKQNAITKTSALLGEFHEDPQTRAEFFSLLRGEGMQR
ncbi:MAG: GTP cyclohydrolase I FolE [Candidatus Latescibacterota bacterium]|nr:MAG: GTP cyclohydrolase I FolE [Candidatus Latescibacterota bacterium]